MKTKLTSFIIAALAAFTFISNARAQLMTVVDFTRNGVTNKGESPYAALVSDGTGNFWGTTTRGGAVVSGAVFKISTGPLTEVIALNNNLAAGTVGAVFSVLGHPAINGNGRVAFQAKLAGGDTNPGNSFGIWTDDSSGVRQLVVRTGSLAPGTANALFATIGNPVYNSNEAVAFLGTLTVGIGDATATNN